MSTEAAPKKRKGKRRTGRRARGEGSIFYHEGRGTWVGRKVVGRSASGKPKIIERWGATQGEVLKKLAAVGPPSNSITVEAWMIRWAADLQVRPRTKANYLDDWKRHILPVIGHLQVVNVTPMQIESLAKVLSAKGLGVNSVRKALKHARIAFSAAVRDRIINVNPVSLARKPQSKRKEVDAFTPTELASIIAASDTRVQDYPIALLAGTGCRAGEAMGLDVGDFDRDACTIAISRTYHKTAGMGPAKSLRSVRTIRVPAAVVPIIEKAIGIRKKGPLFLTTTGRRRTHELVHTAWKSMIARLGLKYRNPHQLRHSVATALISNGAPLGDVAKYLGDSVDTVVKTYLHPTGSDPSKILDGLLGGRTVGKLSRPTQKDA